MDIPMDEKLMQFVNALGLVTFVSIVIYHIITATPKKESKNKD